MYEERLISTCEKHEWKVGQDGKFIELSKYSPLGEDFSFAVERKNAVKNIFDYSVDFDPEEHAAMWIEVRQRPGNPMNVPGSLFDIVLDALDIDSMLRELAEAVKTAMFVKVAVSDIKYETDGHKVEGLPEKFDISVDIDTEDINDEDELEEYLGNYISGATGYLHNGFIWKLMEDQSDSY